MTVTQQQIADLAGVSRATVDRAINKRGRVDWEVAAKIQKIADELGYCRNRAGSLLVRAKKPLRIGIIIQSSETPFMQCICAAIEASRERMRQMGAELLARPIAAIDAERQLAALDALEEEGMDALALTPVENEKVCDRINAIARRIPVVTFNTDLPASDRLCYVGQDSYASGRTCAGLMNVLLGGRGTVLMVTGSLANFSHQRRIDGFRSEIQASFPGIALLGLRRCDDNRRIAYEVVRDALRAHPEIAGIYLSAGGPPGACEAIREMKPVEKVRMICHDCTEENVENVRLGLIDFLIDQDAQTQAVRPLEVLLDYILLGVKPAQEYMLTRIVIYNKYNLP